MTLSLGALSIHGTMDVDFSQQQVAPASPSNGPQQAFGLVVPGGPVRTDFVPVDASGLKFSLRLNCPGDLPTPLTSVTELVFFLLPSAPLPPDLGVLCYWQIEAATVAPGQGTPASTGFELLGAITPTRPSSVFHTGWSEHEQVNEVTSLGVPVTVTIGVSLEPLATLDNVGAMNTKQGRLFIAQKIASDLFKFMQSFDTGAAGASQMVVPNNIFDRWFRRFENRFQRDPNFFLKSDDS
jgi:hypothetical protein